ncbi:MAG: redoxin family protein [Vicinamibacterales bacterium]
MPAAVVRSSLTAIVLAIAVGTAVAQPPGVTDLDGRPVDPLDGGAATVLVFTAVDCPISDRYAPEVRRLAAGFADKGVRTWIVYANAGERPADARAHAAAFGYGLPVAMDAAAALADRAGAEVTPEAAVFDATGRLVYRGRVDDRYLDFGVDRPAPTTHELADAVTAVLAGRAVSRAVVPAVGCAIVRHRP